MSYKEVGYRISDWKKWESRKTLRSLIRRREYCKIEGKEFYRDFPEEYQERVSPIPERLDDIMHYYTLGEIIRWRIMPFKEVCEELGGPISFDELIKEEPQLPFETVWGTNQLIVHELR